jgi:hypothetical protein
MNGFNKWVGQRRKALMAILGIGLTYAAQHWGATNPDVVIAIAALGVIGVHMVPNDPNMLEDLVQDVESILHPQIPVPLPAPEGPSGIFQAQTHDPRIVAAQSSDAPIQEWGKI